MSTPQTRTERRAKAGNSQQYSFESPTSSNINRVNRRRSDDSTIEGITRELTKKIVDLENETKIQRIALNELASVNAILASRCKGLEKENAALWNEIFKMKGPIFPNEITDIFIDFMHDDRVSLACCGLVCRDWIAASRYHLFSSLYLTNSSSNAQMRLRELISDPRCTFKHSVRRIVLAQVEQNTDEAWLTSVIPHLVQMPSVTSLRLVNFDQCILQSNGWNQFLSANVFLDRLTKVNIQKSDLTLNAQSLIQIFPNVTRLHYTATANIMDVAPPERQPNLFADFLSRPLPQKWAKITLAFPGSVSRAGTKWWFRLVRPTPDTVDLYLYEVISDYLPALRECLHLLGSSLDSLTINFADNSSQYKFYSLPGIMSRNTRLRSICFFGSLYYDVKRNLYLESLQNTPGLLKCMPTDYLQRIVLVFVIGDFSNLGVPVTPPSLQRILCSAVDDILTPASQRTHSRLPCLEEVIFRIYIPSTSDKYLRQDLKVQAEVIVGTHFPRLKESGLLKCETNVQFDHD